MQLMDHMYSLFHLILIASLCGGSHHYPHFTDEEAEAQSHEVKESRWRSPDSDVDVSLKWSGATLHMLSDFRRES